MVHVSQIFMRYRLWIFNLEQLEMVNSHQISTSFSYKHFKNENIKQLTLSRMWVKGRSIGQYQNACLACVLGGRGGALAPALQNEQPVDEVRLHGLLSVL